MNNTEFCIAAHTATSALAYNDAAKVSAILADLETAPRTEPLRATLRLLGKLTSESKRQRVGRDGWPIHDILSARLTEAGPTPADLAKDVGAVILSVGDSQPRWIGEAHRTKVMSSLRPVPALAR